MRLGILKEITRMALESLRSHKLRSFLTLLGIMIGVMTVIGMVAIIQGLNRSVIGELESIGSDLIFVGKHEPIQMGHRSEEERKRKDLTLEDAMAIETECSLVKAVAVDITADFWESIPIKYQNIKSLDSIILGMNEKFPQVLSVYLPEEGRFLIESDITHSTKVCVLGSELNDTLFLHTNALGKDIRIGPEKFTVVGILEKRGSVFGQSQDNFVGIPITTLMKYYPYDLSMIEITAVPKKHGYLEETIDQITNVLRKRRKVGFGKPNDFVISTQGTFVDLYNQITGAVYMVMIVISSIGLLVGGIGVMNIMLVSVKERTREIGIRKAIGARSADILKQFLIEAIVLTGTGGALGVIIGFAIAFLVRAATPLPASVTSWSVVLGLFVSISVGLFFGIFPARKAASLDPIVCLRYE
ncbi:MAG TPA: FtsX-like permease family protein [Candidatus Aminicenantes bacterium]|nr:FtsX-like permease family protein [Candidatus Aminicenantes bacterium]HEB36885.1 FtsX-like permease family protein [Candidatus Aminicenantes bacterium]